MRFLDKTGPGLPVFDLHDVGYTNYILTSMYEGVVAHKPSNNGGVVHTYIVHSQGCCGLDDRGLGVAISLLWGPYTSSHYKVS